MSKRFIMGGMIVGSLLGGYVPALWGGSVLSMSSVVWSGIGGLFGIYVGYKIANRYF